MDIDHLYQNYDKNDSVLCEFADLLYDEILSEEEVLLIESKIKKDKFKHTEGIKQGAAEMAPPGHQWVYVCIVNAKKVTTKIIQHFTKEPYNHSTISFDKSLSNMYSFAVGGFVRENIRSYKPDANFSLYKIAVPNDAIVVMKDAIKNIEKTKDQYSYSIRGLAGFIDKRHQSMYNTNERKMFCSQFISKIFASAGMKIFKDKEHYEVKPYDFAKNKNFKFCYKGLVKNFDPGRIR